MLPKKNTHWPVLRTYDLDHLARVAMPVGGIGTGTVSLGGRGDLRDWELMNRPSKGFAPQHTFFALWAQPAGGKPVTRALEGPLDANVFEGWKGATAPNHGLPRFRACRFLAAYPFAQVLLSDPDVPVQVRMEVFNPLIPGDADASGIPVAILRFVITNRLRRRVATSLCGSLQNFIGSDGAEGKPKDNVNRYRHSGGIKGLFMRSLGVDPHAPQWGTMALATTATSAVTHRTSWTAPAWNADLLDFWDDFSEDGRLDQRRKHGDAPMASLAVPVSLPPRATRGVTFLLAWHFPNRQTWTPQPAPASNRIGNYYTTQYRDAWTVATRAAPRLRQLEEQTRRFVAAFCAGDLPAPVKEAALFNLSTLRTQTCFRTEDGHLYGWEGCHDRSGCCPGSCTHVWNYEQAVPFLFGSLARGMREIEFAHATDARGHMRFRVPLPLGREGPKPVAAADGQMGCIMKLYRDWRLSGDDALLDRLWPMARRALEFCWIPGGWDADRDGVMEGCQHNTMDVEYYGPNPQMGAWYLGALRAAEEMAPHVGEADFAATCRSLFNKGKRWTEDNLFNGEYFEHHVRPVADASAIAEGLRAGMGAIDPRNPEWQLGAGCLVDQLVGQFVAHVCGLGYLLKRSQVRKTLRSIMKHNFRRNLHGHFNPMRSYALQDEAALLMSTYPRGNRPKCPFPYANEVMTGFEYTAAVHMLYEGQSTAGLEVIRAIRDRYDGLKRNPFDEAECGHHYARAMTSWAAVPALSGFQYSGVTRELVFAAAHGDTQWFWSNGDAWGLCRQRPGKKDIRVDLTVLHGSLLLKTLALTGAGEVRWSRQRRVSVNKTLHVRVPREGNPPDR